MSNHLINNGADRELGKVWERKFCQLAFAHGKALTPLQIAAGTGGSARWYGSDKTPYTLPDITVWTAPGEHHEIKHKNPTGFGCYGLEEYRLDALLKFREETGQRVLYTIHDWEHAGAQDSRADMPNRIEDWRTIDVTVLCIHDEPVPMPTWLNGQREVVPGYYWPCDLWIPLAELWTPSTVAVIP